jgi:uncharacterized protein YecE (DUF72 family)
VFWTWLIVKTLWPGATGRPLSKSNITSLARLPDYADADLKMWLKRVQDQGWKDAFVFFKHEDEGKGPQMAKRFLELARK